MRTVKFILSPPPLQHFFWLKKGDFDKTAVMYFLSFIFFLLNKGWGRDLNREGDIGGGELSIKLTVCTCVRMRLHVHMRARCAYACVRTIRTPCVWTVRTLCILIRTPFVSIRTPCVRTCVRTSVRMRTHPILYLWAKSPSKEEKVSKALLQWNGNSFSTCVFIPKFVKNLDFFFGY